MSGSTPRPDGTTSDRSPCLRCGACCYQRPGTILVTEQDEAYWRTNGMDYVADSLTPGHFGLKAFPVRCDGACRYLGTPESASDCSIHKDRAAVCRDFEPGSAQCLEFRRDRGMI